MKGGLAGVWARLRYFCSDAWDECRHSPGVNLLAVTTLASVLFLAALVSLVVSNVASRVRHAGEDVRVHVFLRDGIADEERLRLQGLLEAEAGVIGVEYVDKQRALEDYRSWAPDMAQLAGELAVNPLPASFAVALAQHAGAEANADRIIERFRGEAAVESIRFDRALAERLESMVRLARVGGAGVAALVFLAVAFVMAGVVRLAVYARREEIDIMLLVGATPAFVRGPFLVAGLVQGLVAGAAGLGLVEALRRLALARAGIGTLALVDLVAAQPLSPVASGGVLLVGVAVGALGAWFAVRGRALGA